MASTYTGVATAGSVVALPQGILDVYSMDVLHEAVGIMRYEEFLVQKTELGVQPGQTITMTRYNNITRGGQLDEHTDMEETNITASQHSISVTEYGNAVGVTEKLLQMSFDDTMEEAAVLLGRDYAVVNDLLCRDAIAGGTNVLYAGAKSSRAALVGAQDYFDIEVLRRGTEFLQTKNAPKFNGDFYICFVHPHQVAYLKRDPDWVAAQNYANTRALFNGELGRFDDVVFIGTTHARNGAAAATDPGYLAALVGAALGSGTATNVFEALLFADSAVGKATGLPVELRDNGVRDFGRKHGLAWYSIMGAGILEDDFILRIETV